MASTIFWEQQEGSLCAQHALNAALQGAYYTAPDLGTIAMALDDAESAAMAEQGRDTREFAAFVREGSSNMDDSGFFSVQVLEKALEVFRLRIVSLRSSDPAAVAAQKNPLSQRCYILNLREHWFTLRRFHESGEWWNLDSTLKAPKFVSDTYLGMLLQQMQVEKYSCFVVLGDLPRSVADEQRQLWSPAARQAAMPVDEQDPELATAIAASLEDAAVGAAARVQQQEPAPEATEANMDEVRRKRLARFG